MRLGEIRLQRDGATIGVDRRGVAFGQERIAEIEMRDGQIRLDGDGLPEARDRAGAVAAPLERVAQIHLRVGVARRELECLAESGDGVGAAAARRLRQAERVVEQRIALALERGGDLLHRLVVAVALMRDHAEQEERVRLRGLGGENGAAGGFGVVQASGFEMIERGAERRCHRGAAEPPALSRIARGAATGDRRARPPSSPRRPARRGCRRRDRGDPWC